MAGELSFNPLPLAGAYVIQGRRHEDERGWFARSWCSSELEAQGLVSEMVQSSLSQNRRAGTLRGLHYQAHPHEEAKLVTCVQGRIWDVVVDLRPESPTFKAWHGMELDARIGAAIYVPEGFAHGFLTLAHESVVLYQISKAYNATAARGIRWDDPIIGIQWPSAPLAMSDRDRAYAPLAGQPWIRSA